jgi:hypothetical protein
MFSHIIVRGIVSHWLNEGLLSKELLRIYAVAEFDVHRGDSYYYYCFLWLAQ